MYLFYKNVLVKSKKSDAPQKVIDLAKYYSQNNFKIPNEDYGAGSKTIKKELSTKLLLKKVASKSKYGLVLSNIVEFSNSKKILELGSSLGIGTAYLAANQTHQKIISIEGNKALAKLTNVNLNKFNFANIEIIGSTFEEAFEKILNNETCFDLIFIDGNHTKEATIKYFDTLSKHIHNNSVIIFDDIYWSKGMTEAWVEILKSDKVRLSIDIFKFGLIFFRSENHKKEHFTLWY